MTQGQEPKNDGIVSAFTLHPTTRTSFISNIVLDTMKRKVSCKDTTDQKKRLFQLSQVQIPPTVGDDDDDDGGGGGSDDGNDGIFDCSDVAVKPTFDLVEDAVKDFQRRWDRLDDRKIVQTSTLSEVPSSSERNRQVRFQDEPAGKKRKNGGWRFVEDRLRLPQNFDYATLGPEPEDNGTGERVLSISGLLRDDPAQKGNTLSYERELWRLFASIPTARELEKQARAGAQLPHTMALQKKISSTMSQSNPPDAHLLLRMRMADRHGIPPVLPARKADGSAPAPNATTIRFECWRRHPKRNPSPDPHRLALEFLAEQTLLDVHNALVKLAEDDLWDNSTEDEPPSGCFFFEDTFYKHGPVDYSKPILDWIDAGSDKPHPARRGYLGMSLIEQIPVRSMKGTCLGDIPLRLGYRYYHACHGEVETALFVVDRRWTQRLSCPYPILHDVWTPTGPNQPVCEACKTYAVAYITSTSCLVTDGNRRLLCGLCRRQLRIPSVSLQLYSSWRDESSLSTSLGISNRKFF